jgi:hypothetical protein
VIPADPVASELYETDIPFVELGQTAEAVLSALGYDGDAPAPVTTVVNSLLPTLETLVEARGGFRVLGGVRVSVPDGILTCGDMEFDVGKIIAAQLRSCDAIAVFVVTAGAAFGRRSRELTDAGDMLAGYILDVMGSEAAEAAAQWIELKLDAALRAQFLGSTTRYSPGYCGWNVAEQKKLFSFLPENFCGITLSESSLMLPIKSVSGIIGIGPTARKDGYQCAACDDADCLHRK